LFWLGVFVSREFEEKRSEFVHFVIVLVGIGDFTVLEVGPKLGSFFISCSLVQDSDGALGGHFFGKRVGSCLFVGVGLS
jgi:hypothetical protein